MHKDSKLEIMTNEDKSRLVQVIFSNIHKVSNPCANSFGRYIMIAQCLMYEKYFSFLLNSSFSGKMVFLRKLKLTYPSTPKHYNNFLAPSFSISFKKILAPLPFKKVGRNYAFHMRDYKGETIKLLPLYMTDFLFIEL